ncbi:malonic semialdehyde reductase [Marivibrio halodurans]|uniref:Putative NADH dehydrogenase/NAD(P)H nitroreductase KAJ83_14390 n=1 Tax=Marivibrio halodurans TaxID=2039722 RepID=A0A8J7S1L3_9PROT|nr:malonic semialdehyde reductase [Marivibrio halodurans]MBP5858205.1 malonic semialdehyde reductase [Marivibrio halodurans]
MPETIDQAALDQMFLEARTHNVWLDREVSDDLLRRAYELARMAPTSANCQPMRVLFIRSKAEKEKLDPCLSQGNREKTMAAPVTAIVAHDTAFYEQLPWLFPHTDARSWFAGDAAKAETNAFRNGSLQGAYLLLACRAVGLDCGPMSGFDNDKVDAAFLAGTGWKSNFLMNIGHGDPAALRPRGPRPAFDDFCRIL